MRWNQSGEQLASVSFDGVVKCLDFASGKVTYTGKTDDNSKSFVSDIIVNLINCLLENAMSVCLF